MVRVQSVKLIVRFRQIGRAWKASLICRKEYNKFDGLTNTMNYFFYYTPSQDAFLLIFTIFVNFTSLEAEQFEFMQKIYIFQQLKFPPFFTVIVHSVQSVFLLYGRLYLKNAVISHQVCNNSIYYLALPPRNGPAYCTA